MYPNRAITRTRGPARERVSLVPRVMHESIAVPRVRPPPGACGRPAAASRGAQGMPAQALLGLGADDLELLLLLGVEGGEKLLARVVEDRLDLGRDLVVHFVETQTGLVDHLLEGLALGLVEIETARQTAHDELLHALVGEPAPVEPVQREGRRSER